MRVHPGPRKRNIVALRYGDADSSATSLEAVFGRHRKLRRLPHMFSKVLELPLGADAEVVVEEDGAGFRFITSETDGLWGDVRAQAVEIYPGVMKVVIRHEGDGDVSGSEEEIELEFELDRWRFRLPPSTLPALATAAYTNGELVVFVPKVQEPVEDVEGEEGDGSHRGDIDHLVVVQCS